ncbi:MAG: hypothetical protein IPI30_06070 [Saprospiraceae bacterium]|nr:hypothetical protein [Candidatus Vicinibacter affinis]
MHRQRYQSTDLVLGGYYGNKTGFNEGNNSQNFRINGVVTQHFSERLIATLGLNVNTGSSSSFFTGMLKDLIPETQPPTAIPRS